jgi:hypothetical protein
MRGLTVYNTEKKCIHPRNYKKTELTHPPTRDLFFCSSYNLQIAR